MTASESAIVGCLLGTAVGDALGLPTEGLTRSRLRKLHRKPDRYGLFFGRGMFSDDTEHACLTAQALAESAGDCDLFTRRLARLMKVWYLALPPGTGLATLKACIKLLFGCSPQRSGIRSAGNGPTMRSPIIGAFFGDDLEAICEHVRASTRMTHTDPRAEHGALAVALAARLAAAGPPGGDVAERYLEQVRASLAPDAGELVELLRLAAESAAGGESTPAFADRIGCGRGVSGYVYHTVPAVVHAWLSHPCDFRSAVVSVIECGGDTDTTAAIVGGILGASVGKSGIPGEWLRGLMEWPRTVRWIEDVGCSLSLVARTAQPGRVRGVSLLACTTRNLFLLLVILAHGFRRLLPPY